MASFPKTVFFHYIENQGGVKKGAGNSHKIQGMFTLWKQNKELSRDKQGSPRMERLQKWGFVI